MKKLPKILLNDEMRSVIDEIERNAREFQRTVLRAVKRKKCLGGICCKFNKMFGAIEQN